MQNREGWILHLFIECKHHESQNKFASYKERLVEPLNYITPLYSIPTMGHYSRLLYGQLDSGQNCTPVVCSRPDWVHGRGQSPGSSITHSPSSRPGGNFLMSTPGSPWYLSNDTISWPIIWVYIQPDAPYTFPPLNSWRNYTSLDCLQQPLKPNWTVFSEAMEQVKWINLFVFWELSCANEWA